MPLSTSRTARAWSTRCSSLRKASGKRPALRSVAALACGRDRVGGRRGIREVPRRGGRVAVGVGGGIMLVRTLERVLRAGGWVGLKTGPQVSWMRLRRAWARRAMSGRCGGLVEGITRGPGVGEGVWLGCTRWTGGTVGGDGVIREMGTLGSGVGCAGAGERLACVVAMSSRSSRA